jgi:hypothetical protein
MTEAERLKYWNKFKYIEKMNGFSGNWWRLRTNTCDKFCKYNYPGTGPSWGWCLLKYGNKILTTKNSNTVSIKSLKIKQLKKAINRRECLEFLRSPKRHDKTGEKGLDGSS